MLRRMARPRNERPTLPRLPPEVPLDVHLRLTAGAEFDGLTIQGDYSEAHLEGLIVEEAHIVRSSFIATDLSRLKLVDVVVEASDLSGADMEEASFTRVTFKDCRMSGARLPRTHMRDVTFSEVRLDNGNFRMGTGDRVLFDHVILERGDFYSAQLTSTHFFDCDLTGADITKAKLSGARFHGSALIDLKGGEDLRNVVIDSSQVLPLATSVFGGLNIHIEDERDDPSP
jgi:uncharacterized protein YjbI with pentapeptide repeats